MTPTGWDQLTPVLIQDVRTFTDVAYDKSGRFAAVTAVCDDIFATNALFVGREINVRGQWTLLYALERESV